VGATILDRAYDAGEVPVNREVPGAQAEGSRMLTDLVAVCDRPPADR
jgi:hypothetical protein